MSVMLAHSLTHSHFCTGHNFVSRSVSSLFGAWCVSRLAILSSHILKRIYVYVPYMSSWFNCGEPCLSAEWWCNSIWYTYFNFSSICGRSAQNVYHIIHTWHVCDFCVSVRTVSNKPHMFPCICVCARECWCVCVYISYIWCVPCHYD